MAYLIFNTKQEADDKSRDDWEAVLGHPKDPNNVTEFLWGRTEPGKDGRVACVIPDTLVPATMGISAENIAIVKGDPYQVITIDPVTKEETVTIVDPDPLVKDSDKVAQLDKTNWPDPVPVIGTAEDVIK